MFALRLAAYLLAFASFIILIADGAQSIAAGELMMTPLAAFLEGGASAGAAVISVSAGGELLPDLLAKVLASMLAQPAALLVLALAVGLIIADAAMNRSLGRLGHAFKRL